MAYLEKSQGNWKKALAWYKKAARNNNYQALYELGQMHRLGIHVKKDLKLAKMYYRQAVDHGHDKSIYQLAQLWAKDSCYNAVLLFKKVAEYANSKYDLDYARKSYESDKYSQSLLLYSKSGNLGYINGQINAGWLHMQGYSEYINNDYDDILFLTAKTDKNKQLAYKYYMYAALQNHSSSLKIIGDYHYYGWLNNIKLINITMDDKGLNNISDSNIIACNLYEKSSNKDDVINNLDPESIYNLGYCHEHGLGYLGKNISKAREMYRKVMNMSSTDNNNNIGYYIVGYIAILRMDSNIFINNILQSKYNINNIINIENILLIISCLILFVILCFRR